MPTINAGIKNEIGTERRYVDDALADIQLEEREEGQPQIQGYAAVFYNGKPETEFVLWKDTVERIMPGAFDQAIHEDDVRVLFNHDPNLILGRSKAKTLTLQADKRGLRYVNIPPDTTAGQDMIASIRRGDVSGSSFSFSPTNINWRKEKGRDIREIRGVRLFDVGPVVFPAYKKTTAGVRKNSIEETVRAEHRVWLARRDRARATKRIRRRIVDAGLTKEINEL